FNQFPLLVDEINRYKKSGATVLLQVDSQKGLNLLQENLKEYGLDLIISDKNDIVQKESQLIVGHLSNGFYFADEKIVLITETIEIQGIHRDYLTIQYQNADRISIPVEQIELLTKYVSADGKEPKINTLNDG
ncbi:CarD family transcriptional regulator, partial [Listeria monocytogenes]|uniref:CarD family transcriptional regulator n=1 Tax=Listeria monocytogenes TaxID=1639 RepID=UPI000AA5E9BD